MVRVDPIKASVISDLKSTSTLKGEEQRMGLKHFLDEKVIFARLSTGFSLSLVYRLALLALVMTEGNSCSSNHIFSICLRANYFTNIVQLLRWFCATTSV